ncbi:MAG TPA: hypothetical protein VMB52_05965 [Verrucomicrobiae bacterium]|nr:hypothetical protein [Verrucomicrobiae bacterium]
MIERVVSIIEETVNPLRGNVKTLSNDIKNIYQMIGDLQKAIGINGSFEKLTIENKILHLHAELVEVARQAGVSLPSH